MEQKITNSILALFLFVLSSCTTELPVDDGLVKEELVLNAFINPDSLVGIALSHTKAIPGTTNVFRPVPDARVKLFEDGKELETLGYINNPEMKFNERNGESFYRSDAVYPVAGKTYRVEVEHPDYEKVSCETTIPFPVQIIDIDTTNKENSYYNPVRLTFKDPPDFNNHYRILVRAKWGYLITDYGNEKKDTVINVRSDIIKTIDSDDILIKGTADESSDRMVGPPENWFNVFNDETINGKEYTVEFTVPWKMIKLYTDSLHPPGNGEFYYTEIELQSISYDEYWYLMSYMSYYHYGVDFYNEPVHVYSNVENGAGIFAGYAVDRYILSDGEYPKEGINYVYDYDPYANHEYDYGSYSN